MIVTVDARDHAHARRALIDDGVVVLRDAIDPNHVEVLRERFLADLPQVLGRPDAPFNFNPDNVQQSPPRERAFLFADILMNEHVIAVTSSLLPGVKNSFYSGNTALTGTQRQPVHGDSCHLWPDEASPPFGIVVNVPLVDVSAFNGATELWPGSHRIPYAVIGQDLKVPLDLLACQRRVRPPVQPEVAVGSVLLRDLRLWHAGMPNRSLEPRPMLAMVHYAGWWHTEEKQRLRADTKDFFAHPVLAVDAEWEVDVVHTNLDHPYEYATDRGPERQAGSSVFPRT